MMTIEQDGKISFSGNPVEVASNIRAVLDGIKVYMRSLCDDADSACKKLSGSGDFFGVTKENLKTLLEMMIFYNAIGKLLGIKNCESDILRRDSIVELVGSLEGSIAMYRNDLRKSIYSVAETIDTSFEHHRSIESSLVAVGKYVMESDEVNMNRAIALFCVLEKMGFGAQSRDGESVI
jgi:hypothetical protein